MIVAKRGMNIGELIERFGDFPDEMEITVSCQDSEFDIDIVQHVSFDGPPRLTIRVEDERDRPTTKEHDE